MITMGSQRITSPLRKALTVGLASAATVAGGASICGCGSSATVDPVARAADLSSGESGIDFALQVKLTPAGLSRSVSITAHGYVDQAERAARTSIDFAGVPQISALPGGGSGVEAVFIYPRLYMRMPFLADKLPEGKSWMKIDMSKLAGATGSGSLPQALSLGQAEPTQFLMYLRASSGQVRKIGAQPLDGASTTHYRTTLRLSSVLGRLPLGDRAAAKTMLSHAGGAGSVPIDVWIDKQRRVRRIQMSLELAGAVSGPATIAIEFTNYGPVPTISAPKESEVVDLTGIVPSIGASGGLGVARR